MVLPDPILNFLNLLVGLAGGWFIGHATRVWSKPGRWTPFVGLLWMIAAGAATWTLIMTLNLRGRIASEPMFVGTAIGVFLRLKTGK